MSLKSICPSIIVVNWNTRSLLENCIAAVRRRTAIPYELVLVDNGSADGSRELLEAIRDASTRVILLPENRGYAAGINVGIERATGEILCLLNSDTTVTTGWLPNLLNCMERSGASLVGPYTNKASGRQRCRPWFGLLAPPYRRTVEVDFLSFFCVAIRRDVFNRIGVLDERFGYGTCEDLDYCRRAREAGYRLVIDGRSWVWHAGHATFRANRLDEAELRRRNRKLLEEKWRSIGGG